MLKLSGLEQFAGAYPHQLSGQRAGSAVFQALITEPDLLMLESRSGRWTSRRGSNCTHC